MLLFFFLHVCAISSAKSRFPCVSDIVQLVESRSLAILIDGFFHDPVDAECEEKGGGDPGR